MSKNKEIAVEESVLGNKYKSEEQLTFFKSLCDNTFRFYYEVEECYPEIETFIKSKTVCDDLISICECELEEKGFVGRKKVTVSTRSDVYNELIFTFDLRMYENEELKTIFKVLKDFLKNYATPEEQTRKADIKTA